MNHRSAITGVLVLALASLGMACGASDPADETRAGSSSGGDADAGSEDVPRYACRYTQSTNIACSGVPSFTKEEPGCRDDTRCDDLHGDTNDDGLCFSQTLYLDKVELTGTCADGVPAAGGAPSRDAAARDGSHASDAGRASDSAGGGGGLGEGGGGCMPNDVSRFVPVSHPPTGAHQGACTASNIDAFYIDCLGPNSTSQACAHWSGSACSRCILTPSSASSWGPLVQSPHMDTVNVSGCVSMLAPSDSACSNISQAEDECTIAACDVCAFDGTALAQCLAEANQHGCSAYASAPCDAEADGGAAAACFAGADFGALFRTVALLFCGP